MQQEWNIGGRARQCAKTGLRFEEGEVFYTLLFREKDGFRREELSQEAFKERNDNIQPFSHWRNKYEPPGVAAPETLPKQSAEDMLRHFTIEDQPEHRNARYVLALMLERKRILRQVDSKQTDDGMLMVYEHIKSGEIFIVSDPQLHLSEIEPIQTEVSQLLAGQNPTPDIAPEATEAPQTAPPAES